MQVFPRLLDLVSPTRTDDSAANMSRTERAFFAAVALLVSVALGALWGVAAGSHDHHLALDNIGKVPVLVVGSSLVALPVALFVFRLLARGGRASDLMLAHAVGVFAGCLVLALLSPLVALYQFSSSFAGVPVALGSAVLSVVVAVGVVVRVLRKLAPEGSAALYAPPVALALVLQLAALAQIASIATPVFPTRTPMGRGVDGLVQHAEPEQR
ncbi:MAG: hypothetical protein IPG50_34030 [Myxococcales bacterium]|nr:hypothetical protein [Myxococcales bacterium]